MKTCGILARAAGMLFLAAAVLADGGCSFKEKKKKKSSSGSAPAPASAPAPSVAGDAAPFGPIGPPQRPSGPATGAVKQNLSYSTVGTDPLNQHDFLFDWGDGSALKWVRKGTKQSHKYSKAGTFTIRAREKCPLNTFLTDWSAPATVTIK